MAPAEKVQASNPLRAVFGGLQDLLKKSMKDAVGGSLRQAEFGEAKDAGEVVAEIVC